MTRQIPQLSRHVDAQGSGSGHADQYSAAYTIREAPFGTPRPIRIIGVGAGASGINLIRTLRNTLGASTFELVIYEKNEDVGGTWFENRYPGCKCDVPSHNYQFTWRPNPAWSSFFAPAAEIQEYLCRICDDENLRPYIKTSHRVVGAVWSEHRAVWDLQIKDLETGGVFEDYANFFIDSTGILKYVFYHFQSIMLEDWLLMATANGGSQTLRACLTSRGPLSTAQTGPRTSTTRTRRWSSLETERLVSRLFQLLGPVSC